MKPNEDFSIITLDSENDDEIVIQAGFVAQHHKNTNSVQKPEVSIEHENSSLPKDAQSQHVQAKKESYRKLNAADLDEKGPFNMMRLIIIIAGLLLILGFVVIFIILR